MGLISNLKQKVENYLLRHLLCVVDINHVVRSDNTGIYINGKKLDENELLSLKQEVHRFKASQLYQLLQETPKQQSLKLIFEKSENFDDVRNGKMILYTLDVQNKILNLFD